LLPRLISPTDDDDDDDDDDDVQSMKERDLSMQAENERNIHVLMLTRKYKVYKTSICIFCEEPLGSFVQARWHIREHKLDFAEFA
jgi:hypothetical protein